MARRPALPLLLAAWLVVGAPAVSGQSEADVRQDILGRDGTPITFYGHVFGTGAGQPMPMNTEYPWGEEDYSIGTSSTAGCNFPPESPVVPPGQERCTAVRQFWYTTAGFVQVKDYKEFGGDYSRFHNERGQTKDIYIDTSQPANATIYQSADGHGWFVFYCDVGLCWNWDPGYFPSWTVEAWVWHASLGDWSSDPSAQPSMSSIAACNDSLAWTDCPDVTLVAHGKMDPFDMYSFDATIPVVGGQTVWPLTTDLEWDPAFVADGGVIPYQNDLVIEFHSFQESPDGERYLMPQMTWNTNAGEDYPNNVVLPVRNPMDVELVFPRFVHDKLVVLSIINTPWGSYDIDPSKTRLIITDAEGDQVVPGPSSLRANVDASVAHAGHYKPINATWIWDFRADSLDPGEYTATVEVTNFQGSYTTSTSAGFSVADDGTGSGTTAGRSGLASYTQEDFESFNRGAGGATRAPQAADAHTEGPATSASEGSEESPALPLPAVIGVLWLVVSRWFRRGSVPVAQETV